MSESEFRAVIEEFIQEGLAALTPDERAWAVARLVEPRLVDVTVDGGGPPLTERLWLVTDFVGEDRSDYRIVYDDALITFGLVSPGRDGRPVLVGLYGDFAETVRGM